MQRFIRNIANQLARLNAGDGMSINTKAIDCVMHYISGKQTARTLDDSQIAATRRQIIRSLSAFDYAEGEAQIVYEDLNWERMGDVTIMEIFLCSETAGVVGGFNFEIDHDTYIAKCWDVWDFNSNSTLPLELWFPKKLKPMVDWVIRRMGVGEICKLVGGDYSKNYKLEVYEYKLEDFNHNHEFRTEWTVDLNHMACELSEREMYIENCAITSWEMENYCNPPEEEYIDETGFGDW